MSRISDEDIMRVRDATDIVSVVAEYVVLKQRGSEFWGCCPFHNEKTPSFHVVSQTQRWHCFGCGEGGDVFKFLAKIEGLTFPEAVSYLAEKQGITLSKEENGLPSSYRARLIACCQETDAFFNLQLMRVNSADTAVAREYARTRGFDSTVCKKWHLGYAPGRGKLVAHLTEKGFSAQEMIDSNVALKDSTGGLRDRFFQRLMFPIHDLQGRTIAFGGRTIPNLLNPEHREIAKYLNTSNSPLFHKRDNLFGIDKAKASITTRGVAIVVEGYTDVIALHEAGFTQAVATLGTALTPEHVRLLRRFSKHIIYLFDGDSAGQKAADKAADLIDHFITPETGRDQTELSVAIIPGNSDPADYVASEGSQGLQRVLDNAQPLLLFALRRRLETYNLKRPEQRQAALEVAVALLYPFRNSLLAADYLNIIASDLATDYATVAATLERYEPPRTRVVHETITESDEAIASRDADEDRTQILDYSDMLARWERELLSLYVYNPSIRAELKARLHDNSWSQPLHALVAPALFDCDIQMSPAHLVDVISSRVEGSEQIWLVDTSQYLDRDASSLMDLASRMLRGKEIEELERDIARHKAKLKFSDTLDKKHYDELFAYLITLQNRLNNLRNSS